MSDASQDELDALQRDAALLEEQMNDAEAFNDDLSDPGSLPSDKDDDDDLQKRSNELAGEIADKDDEISQLEAELAADRERLAAESRDVEQDNQSENGEEDDASGSDDEAAAARKAEDDEEEERRKRYAERVAEEAKAAEASEIVELKARNRDLQLEIHDMREVLRRKEDHIDSLMTLQRKLQAKTSRSALNDELQELMNRVENVEDDARAILKTDSNDVEALRQQLKTVQRKYEQSQRDIKSLESQLGALSSVMASEEDRKLMSELNSYKDRLKEAEDREMDYHNRMMELERSLEAARSGAPALGKGMVTVDGNEYRRVMKRLALLQERTDTQRKEITRLEEKADSVRHMYSTRDSYNEVLMMHERVQALLESVGIEDDFGTPRSALKEKDEEIEELRQRITTPDKKESRAELFATSSVSKQEPPRFLELTEEKANLEEELATARENASNMVPRGDGEEGASDRVRVLSEQLHERDEEVKRLAVMVQFSKRQSEEEHRGLKQSIATLEERLASRDATVKQLQSEITMYEERLEASGDPEKSASPLDVELQVKDKRLAVLEKKVAAQQEKLNFLRGKLSESEDELQRALEESLRRRETLDAAKREHDRETDLLRDELRAKTLQCDRLMARLESAEGEHGASGQQVSVLTENVLMLRTELEQAQQRAARLTQALRASQAERDARANEVMEAKRILESRDKELRRVTGELQERQRDAVSLEDEIRELKSAQSVMQQKGSEQESIFNIRKEKLVQDLENARTQIREQAEEIERLRARLESETERLSALLDDREKDVRERSAELANTEAKLERSEADVSRLESDLLQAQRFAALVSMRSRRMLERVRDSVVQRQAERPQDLFASDADRGLNLAAADESDVDVLRLGLNAATDELQSKEEYIRQLERRTGELESSLSSRESQAETYKKRMEEVSKHLQKISGGMKLRQQNASAAGDAVAVANAQRQLDELRERKRVLADMKAAMPDSASETSEAAPDKAAKRTSVMFSDVNETREHDVHTDEHQTFSGDQVDGPDVYDDDQPSDVPFVPPPRSSTDVYHYDDPDGVVSRPPASTDVYAHDDAMDEYSDRPSGDVSVDVHDSEGALYGDGDVGDGQAMGEYGVDGQYADDGAYEEYGAVPENGIPNGGYAEVDLY